jgi:hypothetical protein
LEEALGRSPVWFTGDCPGFSLLSPWFWDTSQSWETEEAGHY